MDEDTDIDCSEMGTPTAAAFVRQAEEKWCCGFMRVLRVCSLVRGH